MTHLTDEQLDKWEQVAQQSVDAAWERNVSKDGYKQVDDQRILDGVNILFDLITVLRAEREAHQATRAELEVYRTHGDDMASAIEQYVSDGNDSRMIYAQELWDIAREKQDAARAGQGKGE